MQTHQVAWNNRQFNTVGAPLAILSLPTRGPDCAPRAASALGSQLQASGPQAKALSHRSPADPS